MRCALFVWGLLVAGGGAAAQQGAVEPLEMRRLGELQGRIDESSGLAVSRTLPGVLWTHNDSGDGPNLYAVDTSGVLLATFRVTGARAVDWEDLAQGPCPWDSTVSCLFIGDTGDNNRRRTRVVVYAVPEPRALPPDPARAAETEPARFVRIRFAEGPNDAEALAAHPDGALSIITKGQTGSVLRYELPAAAWSGGDAELAAPDTLPLTPQLLTGRWVTGAAVAPDGDIAVVRTYTEIYRFRVAARWERLGPPCWIGLADPLGEAIDFLDRDRLILSNERGPGSAYLTLVVCH